LAIGFVTPARGGPSARQTASPIPTWMRARLPGDYIWIVPALLLVPTFVVLMACIDAYASEAGAVGRLGLSFALVYAPIVAIDYFIQFTVIAPSLRSGQTEGLSLFTMYNPHGLFVALESLGYWRWPSRSCSQRRRSKAAGSNDPSGGSSWPASSWRRMFLGLYFAGSDIVGFEVAVLSIDWIVLIVTGVLLAVVFRRAGRPASSRLAGGTSG